MTDSTRSGVLLELNFGATGDVLVVPENNDKMILSIKKAVAACRAYDDQVRFGDQYRLLTSRLSKWIKERNDRVQRASLTLCETGLMFIVVLRGAAYDEQLDAELTELDLEIANDSDYKLIRLSMMIVPHCSDECVKAYVHPEINLSYNDNA